MHFLHQKPSTTRQISYQEWQYASVSEELEIFLLPGSTAFGYMMHALQKQNNHVTQSFWRVSNFIEFSNLSLSCLQGLILSCSSWLMKHERSFLSFLVLSILFNIMLCLLENVYSFSLSSAALRNWAMPHVQEKNP